METDAEMHEAITLFEELMTGERERLEKKLAELIAKFTVLSDDTIDDLVAKTGQSKAFLQGLMDEAASRLQVYVFWQPGYGWRWIKVSEYLASPRNISEAVSEPLGDAGETGETAKAVRL